MKKYLFILLLSATISCIIAQDLAISNINVEAEMGSIVINYDLTATNTCQITIIVSTDGGGKF